jgi:hypothetical protein
MFDKSFVINLPFKADRLEKFQQLVPDIIGPVVRWPAVHGDAIRHPDWWTAGAGAWGCYRSHLQILEHCYQYGVESYIVFEDDAIPRHDSETTGRDIRTFMDAVPDDWEMLYFGGQLLHVENHPPTRVNDEVFIPYNINRTHCFAVHRRGYEKLYKHLNETPFHKNEHIDHHLGRLHETGTMRIYCPKRWLFGQDAGPSNISGQTNPIHFWLDPEKAAKTEYWKNTIIPCVFLETSVEVAAELDKRGWHRGHWRNDEGLDRGICAALGAIDCKPGLVQWARTVTPEAVREGHKCVSMFHPAMTWECVKTLDIPNLVRIKAETAHEADDELARYMTSLEPKSSESPFVRHLIYHIWPKKGNGIWQWNVAELLKRIDQFDGTRTIAVVSDVDGTTDSFEDVQRVFEGHRVDTWLPLRNDPALGEVVTFKAMLDKLPRDPFSITFYGHAKGTSYDDGRTRDWADMMYQACLDDTHYVDEMLKLSAMAGAFTNTQWPGNTHNWHYSGTFYWFKNADVFSRKWDDIRQTRWGAELWPGDLFALSEVGCLFGPNCDRMYNYGIRDHMKSLFAEWKANRRVPVKSVNSLVKISVIIPTLGRDTLPRMVESVCGQLSEHDELIIVADGPIAKMRAVQQLGENSRIKWGSAQNHQSVYGNVQRNVGAAMATGDVLWFVDDDDTVEPGAIETIRSAMQIRMEPTVFRMDLRGKTLPPSHDATVGHIGGPQLVVPNLTGLPEFPVPAKTAATSDFEWVEAVNEWRPIQFNDTVIYRAGKQSYGNLA